MFDLGQLEDHANGPNQRIPPNSFQRGGEKVWDLTTQRTGKERPRMNRDGRALFKLRAMMIVQEVFRFRCTQSYNKEMGDLVAKHASLGFTFNPLLCHRGSCGTLGKSCSLYASVPLL